MLRSRRKVTFERYSGLACAWYLRTRHEPVPPRAILVVPVGAQHAAPGKHPWRDIVRGETVSQRHLLALSAAERVAVFASRSFSDREGGRLGICGRRNSAQSSVPDSPKCGRPRLRSGQVAAAATKAIPSRFIAARGGSVSGNRVYRDLRLVSEYASFPSSAPEYA